MIDVERMPPEAVAALAELVEWLRERARRVAGECELSATEQANPIPAIYRKSAVGGKGRKR